MVDQVFSFGELAFQEIETGKYLTGILEKNGFAIERDYAGIPTAWVATWGSGKPVIALGSDIDCLLESSQKPGVAYHDPLMPGAPGHGEGHNSGVPLNITAALAVKKIMEREHLSGTLKLWPGVAEEVVGAKAYFVHAGLFKDVDISLFAHVGSNFGTGVGPGTGTGLESVEYTFTGESAHAAANPWRGRSALDAVELMDVGWNFRREHLRLSQRSHYVITDGGDQPNVVPSTATVWYYLPRDRLRAHQGAAGDRRSHGAGRGDDDRHDGHLAPARIGLAGAHEQADRRSAVREHHRGRAAEVGRCGSGAGESAAEGTEAAGDRPAVGDSAATRGYSARIRTMAAGRTTSATSRGTCRRRRLATRPTSRTSRATTGRMPSPWPRRSRTKA